MLVIRLRRIGRKHDPHYRVVVAEHTSPVQGKFIAEIGHYHPKSKETVINQDLLNQWIAKGAKPSNTVAKLCNRQGVTHKHIVVKQYQGKPKKKAAEAEKPQATSTVPTESQNEADQVEGKTDEAAEEAVEDAPTSEESESTETNEEIAEV